jgi:hypothetical protein
VIVAINHESKDGLVGEPSVGYDEIAPFGQAPKDFRRRGSLCSHPKGNTKKACPRGNNDHLNYDPNAEDLGLDWRYSRGLGLTQQTLFPAVGEKAAQAQPFRRWCKPGVPSREYAGRCFTARDLVDPELGILAGVLRIKAGGATAGQSPNPAKFWRDWGGGGSGKVETAEYAKRVKDTRSCNPQGIRTSFLGATRCRGDAPVSLKECLAASAARVKEGKLGYRCKVPCPNYMRYPVKQQDLKP